MCSEQMVSMRAYPPQIHLLCPYPLAPTSVLACKTGQINHFNQYFSRLPNSPIICVKLAIFSWVGFGFMLSRCNFVVYLQFILQSLFSIVAYAPNHKKAHLIMHGEAKPITSGMHLGVLQYVSCFVLPMRFFGILRFLIVIVLCLSSVFRNDNTCLQACYYNIIFMF